MKRLLASVAMSAVALGTGFVAAAPANAAAPTATAPSTTASALTTPITGSTSSGATFTGTLSNLQAVDNNGTLAIVGDLTGTLTSATGALLGTVTDQPVTLPATASGTCQILHLDLGPLDLNLLGLQVHLNEVVLDITAQSGSGQLLGNLLCAVAHLLDNTSGGIGGLATLINQILGAL
jgi:hypothetical protein